MISARLTSIAMALLVVAIGMWARTGGTSPPAPANGTRTLASTTVAAFASDDRRLLPLPAQPAAQAGLTVNLHGLDGTARTIQVAVLADHRGTFAWETRLPAGATSTTLRLDLRDPAPWRAVDHAGVWTPYELAALREMVVQGFPPLPSDAQLTCSWQEAPAATQLTWCTPGPDRLPLGQRWELRCAVDGIDPWAPDRSGLELVWSEPDGTQRRLAPFLFQAFTAAAASQDAEHLTAIGPKHLRVRARPTASGLHRWQLLHQQRVLTEGQVEVGPGAPPPFVHIDPARPRWFLDPDGRAFQPIGWVVAYPVDRPYGSAYRPYLEQHQTLAGMLRQVDYLADAGGNCLRLWLCDWWGGLEWSAGTDAYLGIGRWNLRHAWQVDRVLERCAARGVRVLLCTYNHVRLVQQYGWPEHPYREFLRQPADYWSDPRAAAASDAVLAAVVARWADDPSVLVWDHMSESDLIAGGAWPAASRHILQRLQTLRARDPWRRPAGNHLCIHNRDPAFVRAAGLDYFTSNAYPSIAGLAADQGGAVRDFARTWADLGKPVLITEYGGHWAGEPPAQMRRALRAGLWAGLGSDLSGAPFAWWWNAIAGDDLGGTWAAASAFLAGDDPAAEDTAEHGFWQARPTVISGAPAHRLPAAHQVGSDRLRRLILLDPATTARVEAEPLPTPPATARLAGLRPGPWRIDWWDDQHRTPLRRSRATVGADGGLELAVPPFSGVLALRLAHDPAAREETLAVPTAPAVAPRGSGPVALSWVLQPQVPPAVAPLAERVIWEVPIALPAAAWGRPPRVTRAGQPIACDWSLIDGGRSWLLRLPGDTVGPVEVAVADEPGPAWQPDLSRIGLRAEGVRFRGPALADHAAYARAFVGASSERAAVRVDGIDTTGDATGLGPEHTLVRFDGPLLLPEGEQILALNADDGMSLALDGRVVVAWAGSHGAEVENRPAENRWLRRGTWRGTGGFHALEAFHQQLGGAQLARVGWAVVGAQPAPLPPWRCDGRLPVAVELRRDGRTCATLLPRPDLELNAPRRRFGVLGLRVADGGERTVLLPDPGWHEIAGADGPLPVRSLARHAEEHPLALRRLETEPVVEALAWDCTFSVVLEVDGRRREAQTAAPGAPARWRVTPSERSAPLRLLAAKAAPGTTVELLSLPATAPPGEIPGLGLTITAAWFTGGHDTEALLAHITAALRAGGPAARLRVAADLDRRPAAIRDVLRRCRRLVGDALADPAGRP